MKHIAAAIGVLVALTTTTARADTITDWNQTAIAVMKTANVTGNPWTRHMAMVHVAMSDAVNSVQGKYARYVAKGELARDASAEAAASSAARHILLQSYPNQKTAIDEAHAKAISGIADGPAKTAGLALGEQIAKLVSRRSCGRRHQRAGHLPADHDSGSVGPDRSADLRAIRTGQAVGAEERRPVPAGPAAPTDQRDLCARLQRNEKRRRCEKHGADSRAERRSEVLDAAEHQPRLARGGAPDFGREGTWARGECKAVCAAQHGHG